MVHEQFGKSLKNRSWHRWTHLDQVYLTRSRPRSLKNYRDIQYKYFYNYCKKNIILTISTLMSESILQRMIGLNGQFSYQYLRQSIFYHCCWLNINTENKRYRKKEFFLCLQKKFSFCLFWFTRLDFMYFFINKFINKYVLIFNYLVNFEHNLLFQFLFIQFIFFYIFVRLNLLYFIIFKFM